MKTCHFGTKDFGGVLVTPKNPKGNGKDACLVNTVSYLPFLDLCRLRLQRLQDIISLQFEKASCQAVRLRTLREKMACHQVLDISLDKHFFRLRAQSHLIVI